MMLAGERKVNLKSTIHRSFSLLASPVDYFLVKVQGACHNLNANLFFFSSHFISFMGKLFLLDSSPPGC
jgi:hypothetical protein